MCITVPGRVLAVDGADAIVDIDGRTRRATRLLVPEVRPGDWVIVGSGAVLRRLRAAEATAIVASIQDARGDTGDHPISGGIR
jgi:hydrogenase expression/formation protein HypC